MTIQEKMKKARLAVEAISGYTQEQVDQLVYEGAKIIYENAVPLARLAVDETGLGKFEDKICKNTDTPTVFYEYLKDKKSVGIIREVPEEGLIEVAHPVGVIGAITPATNPTVTPLGNFMHAVKGKNAIIISPAPRSEKTTKDTVALIRQALESVGAPADLIQVVDEVSIQASRELMESCDLVLATGGPGLTKAAYASGTPAYGVGPGNPPVILDRGFNVVEAAKQTVVAVGSDNGILCDGDNLLLYPADADQELCDALRAEGVIVYEDAADVAKFREVLFHDGHINSDLVGKDAAVIAKAAGFDIADDTYVIALKIDAIGKEEVMTKEIMGPIVVLKSYETFEEAVDMAVNNMKESGGIGHTAGIFTHNQEHIRYAGEKIPVARLLVNQPTPDAWGPATNCLTPAVSEGCGTWGNNILSANVDYIHLVNVSKIAMPLDVEIADAAKVFGK
ncbi:aldehyde dehydrogenase family protein [Chakrabartyella piscis]|uniref:aldehyde dehydrogenase family protein n=1 Tax=Chakrabartyella piscis TaxID=2918914 RepID=UPI0029589C27|nr:aldehyde dehydrogenase family protein [Chakrabartyella piscis]